MRTRLRAFAEAVAGMALVLTVAPATAHDQGISSARLSLQQTSGRAAISWRSNREPRIHKGADGTLGLDATFDVVYTDDGGNRAHFDMPDPWINAGPVARYRNPSAPGGRGGVRLASIKDGSSAKVMARSLGDSSVIDIQLPGPNGITVMLTINNPNDGSTHRLCSRFPAASTRFRTTPNGRNLRAKGGMPAPCPTPATSQLPCPSWPMYGATLARTFSAPCPSSLTTANTPTLLPAWSFDTAKTVTASPVVAGGIVYVGDWAGIMYAVDAADGSLVWSYQTAPAPGSAFGPIDSSAAIADLPVRRLVIFGAGPRLYALDAADGSLVWVTYVGAVDGGGTPILPNDPIQVESSPLVWNDTVYVGMDTHNHPDADTGGIRGGVLALDVHTGNVLWKFEPELGLGEGCGGVWSSPALDPSRGLVFFGTANCERDPAHPVWASPHVEDVSAIDAATGAPVWAANLHVPNRLDVDFGATPNLFMDADGRTVVGAGGKDALYYALDPDTGTTFWSTLAAEPGNIMEDFAVGGFIGSPAIFGGNVFGGTALGGAPYFHALDGRNGGILWQDFTVGPSYAASATVNGVVFHGALDNLLRGYDAASGTILFSMPLQGPISSGPAIVGDSLYVGSGTSSSDLCAKPGDDPLSVVIFDLCLQLFEESLGATGAVHAFRLPPLP